MKLQMCFFELLANMILGNGQIPEECKGKKGIPRKNKENEEK